MAKTTPAYTVDTLLELRVDGLILASPCNPAGTMLAPDELAAIARWCHLLFDGPVPELAGICDTREVAARERAPRVAVGVESHRLQVHQLERCECVVNLDHIAWHADDPFDEQLVSLTMETDNDHIAPLRPAQLQHIGDQPTVG